MKNKEFVSQKEETFSNIDKPSLQKKTPETPPQKTVSPEFEELLLANKALMKAFANDQITLHDAEKHAAHAHRAVSKLHGTEREQAEEIWKTWSSIAKGMSK